jgi:hypothetical protein
VGGKVFDSLDLVLWQQDVAKFTEVEPLVGGAFYAAEIEVERVNVHVGFHWRAPKKQEPLPKQRLRALLRKQSGVMITKLLTNAWGIVKWV